jgi:hypothetical protein
MDSDRRGRAAVPGVVRPMAARAGGDRSTVRGGRHRAPGARRARGFRQG